MDRHRGELVRDLGMTLATCRLQVVHMDGRGWIGARKDPVDTVTRGAVGDSGISCFALEAMIAVDKGGQFPCRKTVLLIQDRRLVTGCAGLLRQVHPGDRRSGIVRGDDPMLSMTMGADRRIGLTPLYELAMDD